MPSLCRNVYSRLALLGLLDILTPSKLRLLVGNWDIVEEFCFTMCLLVSLEILVCFYGSHFYHYGLILLNYDLAEFIGLGFVKAF